MKQNALVNGYICLLLSKDSSCYSCRGTGERKHKPVRGYIVVANLSDLDLVTVKKSEAGTLALTDMIVPFCVGPNGASRICKLFNFSKENDVQE
uniref:Small ribosomal subunit protein eS6 n=1 Tax=Monodelphis domestica TaxID=13616 RepID=A0A5F8GMZ9_MONDO